MRGWHRRWRGLLVRTRDGRDFRDSRDEEPFRQFSSLVPEVPAVPEVPFPLQAFCTTSFGPGEVLPPSRFMEQVPSNRAPSSITREGVSISAKSLPCGAIWTLRLART